MKIALINASPKLKASASGVLAQSLAFYAKGKCETVIVDMHKPMISEMAIEQLKECDSWVIFFPLYVDGVPGHIIPCLQTLEGLKNEIGEKFVCAVSNCGFYEGIQARYSLDIIRNWTRKAGHVYGGGVGIGGGGGVTTLMKPRAGAKPFTKIERSLANLLNKAMKKECFENNYPSIWIPRWIYKFAGERGWYRDLARNGKKKEDIKYIPQ